ncbi:MAG: hypothetical protein EOP67_27080, partial [Sphingomonas sp.]
MKVRAATSGIALMMALAGCGGDDGDTAATPPPAATTPAATTLAGVVPAVGETAAYRDTLLKLTFDAPPVVTGLGTIRVYRSDGTLVDTIDTSPNV